MTTLYDFMFSPTESQKQEIETILSDIIQKLSNYPQQADYYLGWSFLPKHTSQTIMASLKTQAEEIKSELKTTYSGSGTKLLQFCNALYEQLADSDLNKIFTDKTRAHLIYRGLLSLLRVSENALIQSFHDGKAVAVAQLAQAGMHATLLKDKDILIMTVKSILNIYFNLPLDEERLRQFTIRANASYPLESTRWDDVFKQILPPKSTQSNTLNEREITMGPRPH